MKSLSKLLSLVVRSGVVISGFALFAISDVHARTFDLKSQKFATYFGGSFGLSNVGDYAFGQSGGTGVSTDQAVRTNYSGEFGLVFTSANGGIRIGGEYLLGKALAGVSGTNSSGASYYSMDSRVTAFVPMLTGEFPILKRPESRVTLGGGAGCAFVYLDQEYRMTPAGTAVLGVPDYIEKSSTRALAWKVFISFETTFVDSATLGLDLGYRSVKIGSLQSSKDTKAISGTQVTGGDVKNMDGSNRAFDLGGAYGSLWLRLYL